MIIDLARFISAERPSWMELEAMLDRLAREPGREMTLDEARRFHFLYQKTSADLARVATFASEPELRRYLESLVARAYGEIHEMRAGRRQRPRPVQWFLLEFPRAFRRRFGAFLLSCAVTLVGMLFGGFAVLVDDEAKDAVLPPQFSGHLGDPRKRVEREEKQGSQPGKEHLDAMHGTFASSLMSNNIKVSIVALALGMTFGVGTLIVLFYNGVMLGLIVVDYIRAGETVFMLGWLMPHGVIEIPAILIAGQAGLLLGQTLIGRGDRTPLAARLRAIGPDLATLIGGVSVMLVWAGMIESFLSQYHEPVIPYWSKITFGSIELLALAWLLSGDFRRTRGAANAVKP